MTIKTTIDREKKFVHVQCSGNVNIDDLFAYQDEVWVNGDVQSFDALFDGRQGAFSQIEYTNLLNFSKKAASIDNESSYCKMAIVVANDEQKKLASFYKSAVDVFSPGQRRTRIFRSIDEAWSWLG